IAPAPSVQPDLAEKIRKLPVILVQGDADVLVKVQWVRPWAERMKELGMTYEYIEVKGGDHIFVAFSNLPKIFAFFDKHKRGEVTEDAAAPAGQADPKPASPDQSTEPSAR